MSMKLKEFLLEQLLTMKDKNVISPIHLKICLDENGNVVKDSQNTIEFTVAIDGLIK